MARADEVLEDALALKPVERAELIDELLSGLGESDAELDAAWAQEAESRIDAYEHGTIKAVALEKVLERYK